MPYTSKRQTQCLNAIRQRWSNESRDPDPLFDESVFSMDISDEEELDTTYLNFKDMIRIDDLADLFELCKNECNIRYLSVLIYMILHHFNILYQETSKFLKNIGGLTAQVAYKWSILFMDGNCYDFIIDERGGKQYNSFYDIYLEHEVEAKLFAVLECQQKAVSFTVQDLANFIDKQFYEITNTNKIDTHLVRFVESCRLDLRRWRARFEANTNRLYFDGQVHPDVLAHRHQFIHHFLSNKSSYYTITDTGDPQWEIPTASSRTILVYKTSNLNMISVLVFVNTCLDHDESTFRSGDIRARCWVINNSAPFFSKGHGRGIMISDFLVAHPSGSFFQLNEKE